MSANAGGVSQAVTYETRVDRAEGWLSVDGHWNLVLAHWRPSGTARRRPRRSRSVTAHREHGALVIRRSARMSAGSRPVHLSSRTVHSAHPRDEPLANPTS